MTQLVAVEQTLGTPESPWFDPVAYYWLSPVAAKRSGSVAEVHVCAKPGWQGAWMTPSVICEGFDIFRRTGARYILALHTDPEYRDLLQRLGWKAHGDFVHVLDLEKPSVISEFYLRRRGGRARRAAAA